MIGPNINIIWWNVRGLNTQARRAIVRETLASTTCHLAYLQETKISNMDQNLADYLEGTIRGASLKNQSRARGTEF